MTLFKRSPFLSKKDICGGGSLFLALSGICGGVNAQVPDAGALQQQLQREVDRGNQVPPPEVKGPQAKPPAESKASSKDTVDVSTFEITGNTLISPAAAQAAVAPYEHRTLSFDQIKEAANAVAALYTSIGRVAQAVIPPQNVTNGVIQIKIIEGKVGETVIELNKDAPSRLKPKVIQQIINQSNAPGSYIDLHGLERSLAILNEMPGNEVDGQLVPGSQEETTNIAVSARDTGWYSGRVDLSNYGSANTGVGQAIGNLNLNNLSGYGDQAQFDAIGSEGSFFGQVRYGIPIGSDGWRFSIGGSSLRYNSLSSFSSTNTSGNAQSYGVYAQYPLERTARANTSLNINYENKNYLNNTNGSESSKYQLKDFSIGISGNRYLADSFFIWGLTGTAGNLNIINTNQYNNDQNGAATNGSFGKLTFNANVTKPLPLSRTNLVVSANGQFSSKNLNSAEQIYLGGVYAVRAYPVAQGGGAQGAVASVELNHAYENRLQLGIFFDAGLVQQYVNLYNNWQGQTHANNTYSLYASGLTGKYSVDRLQVSAAVAFRVGQNPLYNQSGQQLNVDNKYGSVQGWIKATCFF